ncbi:MAG: hypothetical protein ACI9KE_006552 [Polyangiales bacterium]|jgi:hypothetical protein
MSKWLGIAALVLSAGCYASHGVEAVRDAGLIDTRASETGPRDTEPGDVTLDRSSPPVRSACDLGETCELDSSQLLPDLGTDRFRAWLPQSDTYLARDPTSESFSARRGAAVHTFPGFFVAALETDQSIVVNWIADAPQLTILDRDSLEVITTLRSELGWLGLAATENGFVSLRVERLGDDEFFLWMDEFDPRGEERASSGFPLPSGGWSSTPHYTVIGNTVLFGWAGDDGCAHALWFRDGEVLSETVLHCSERSDCQAEPVEWTREQDGRVGFVVQDYCDGTVEYLVGTLGGPGSSPTLTDVCATRKPVVAIAPGGEMRALVTRSFVVHDLRFNADGGLRDSRRVAESATGLALGPDGGLLYGTITDDVFSARCAP